MAIMSDHRSTDVTYSRDLMQTGGFTWGAHISALARILLKPILMDNIYGTSGILGCPNATT